MNLKELCVLKPGYVFELGRDLRRSVNIRANGKLIGEGELVDIDGNDLVFVEFNQDVVVKVYFEAYAQKELSVNISIFDDKKNNIIGCGFPNVDQPYLVTKEGSKYLAEYSLKLPLQEGNYSLRVNISSTIVENETAEFIDVVSDAVVFRVGRWETARVWSKVHGFSKLKLHEF